MRNTKFALVLLASAVLAACGGSTGSKGGDQALKTKFSSQVSFGDSLSDLGTYQVGTVAAVGGGRYTINGDNTSVNAALTGKNWTELMAAQFGLPAPCPAMQGLDGDASKGFSVPVKTNSSCFSYAQGGARVTNPVGPGHKLTGSALGQLTVPVVTQVANHLKVVGGKFKGDEIVFVMAGGNDALIGLGQLEAGAKAAGEKAGAAAGAAKGAEVFATTLVGLLASGATNPQTAAVAIGTAVATESARAGSTTQTIVGAAVGAAAIQPGNAKVADPNVYGPMVAKAQAEATTAGTAAGNAAGLKAAGEYVAANAPKLVPAMATAGAELAALVKTQIVGNGANYVVVNNLPDLANAPAGKSQDASTQALIASMVNAFNQALSAGLTGESKVMIVDLYTISNDQVKNPGPYGLTNVTTPACGANALGTTSLACNAKNLISGDVSHYMFADDVHPTPFENLLIARYVAQQMIARGWL